MRKLTWIFFVGLLCWLAPTGPQAAGPPFVVSGSQAAGADSAAPRLTQVPLPKVGAATVGDDYFLANYTQYREYLALVAKASDRIKLIEIGKTSEGRPIMTAIITSPENHKNLEKYRDIAVRLTRAEGITEAQARGLAAQGKAVVWLDGGLHATETVNSQTLFWTVYQLTSQTDAETLRFLNDAVVLVTNINPDGLELVANWYMREADPKKREMRIPRLYNKYAGHDNNRDFFMANLSETQGINRQLWSQWMPQIVHNAHQPGPPGSILFVPPYRDPFNYNMDPLVVIGIDMVGAAITSRFLTEGKGGSVSVGEASYSTWGSSLLHVTPEFHNQIGILTEIIGNPTPMEVSLVLDRQLPHGDLPMPIAPQPWHLKQSIDYVLSAQRAIIDVAARNKDVMLYRMWRMGMNSIERGSADHWTLQPSWIEQAKVAAAKEAASDRPGEARVGSASVVPSKYYDLLRTPERRDPRGYIIPSNQADFLTATKFVNALIRGGIEVHRATSAFQAAGKSYPAGSYVLKAAQAFRPHLRDMMEPQDHPNDFFYPGGPPKPPYDMTGYTLAFQMGVQFDRVLDAFDGPFEKLPFGEVIRVPAGKVVAPQGAVAGYLLSHQVRDSFTVTNRLLGAKEDVLWLQAPLTVGGKTYPAGTIYIPARPTTKALVDKLAADLGVSFDGTATAPGGEAFRLRPVRVGLLDQYGGSMPSGWVRYLFEQQFHFSSFEVVYPPQLDAGNLKAKFDVIIAMDGIPRPGPVEPPRNQPPTNLPPEWADKVGTVTAEKTIPQLRKFVEEGGTILAVGPATNIAYHLDLPVADQLVERTAAGAERPLPSEKYFVPGSIVLAKVDTTHPLAYGLSDTVDLFFSRSPVFRLRADAVARGTKVVAWYGSDKPVHSGWGWGQSYLADGLAAVETRLGKGKVLLFGPEITFRGEAHGSFPLLFNGIYYSTAESELLGPTARPTSGAQ